MDTFELDSDAFYICTEVSPRNFVVQKAIQIDKSQIERMVGKLDTKVVESSDTSSSVPSAAHSPVPSTSGASGCLAAKPPPLPYWFNRECKSTLMMIGPQPTSASMPSSSSANPPTHFVPSLPGAPPMTREEIKQQLKIQLEYYFSRENLMTDRYLKCQMDTDQYVPIQVLAGFRKIVQLTDDVDLVIEALKESAVVELDESGEKVRAITKRTTIIIREIPENYREEVIKLLSDGPPFLDLKYGHNDSWYVTFDNELNTQVAYVAVQHKKNEITQRPVCARIKAGGPPSLPPDMRNGDAGRLAVLSNGETGTIQLREIGQTLADYGFVPVATFRPGEPILSHFEYMTPTFRFSGNNVAYQPGQQPPPPPLVQPQMQQPVQQQQQQQQYYYSSSVSTTPRNFDEMSTASSASTRTSASNYNRKGVRGGGDQRRFQNNQNHQNHQNNGERRTNNWRGGYRNGSSNHHNHNNYHNHNNHNNNNNSYRQVSSSSSSSASSKYFSPEAVETPTNSVPNSPPNEYSAPTPTDLPAPPVWPAPSFDRRRKSSEASTTTTITPVTPTATIKVFEHDHVKENGKENGKENEQKPVEAEKVVEKVQSPIATSPPPLAAQTFSFEETAFPSLPKKPEPEKKPQKPTFSSVAAGRRNVKQMAPEKKTSYAEKLKQRQSLLRH